MSAYPTPAQDTAHDPELRAQRFREARDTVGLTQQDVADYLGISRTAIVAIEGARRNVSGLELLRLARLYRRPLGWLLGLDDDPPISAEIQAATVGLTERDRDAVLAFARFLATLTLDPDSTPPRWPVPDRAVTK